MKIEELNKKKKTEQTSELSGKMTCLLTGDRAYKNLKNLDINMIWDYSYKKHALLALQK